VLGCPFGEGECGAAENLLHGARRRSRLLGVVGQGAEQPVGDVLGKALGEHSLAELLGGRLLEGQLLADGLANEAALVALGE
jgi:hypothetical protein